VRVQEAEIALAQAQIAETEIRAPFDGVVGLRFVSMGAYVNAATRIATLQQIDRLKLDFSVPEKYAAQIRPGSKVTFLTADGERHDGEIYAVDPRIDSSTRTVLGRAVCRNERGRLLPGAFASVEIALARLDHAVLIPAQAIIPGLDDRSVFVLRDGKAERRTIQTGARTAGTVHVLAGLAAGELVITSGLVQLRPGQRVNGLPMPLSPTP
jgi:membrane fusion protein (multidrug efflux system)